MVYECDGLPHHKYRPRAVVFPGSTEQTSAVMRELASASVPFTPRGAGTGLSGGALALNSGVVVEMARMRKILRIDPDNRIAVVQPGVVNLQVSRAVAPYGLYYVPDPSSQPTCTIGGNIAESAGGIHCLKYGTTTDHVLGCKVVLSGGEVVELGGFGAEDYGYDLLGTFIGSEGTFGIATEATLRLVQIPPAVRTLLAEFAEVNDASHAVSAIIAAGVMPAALEMMDREIIRAVEASVFAAGLPPDAGAALLIELDGIEAGLDGEADRVTNICMEHGARNCRLARDENERKKLWAARKGAFGAIGRISPDSMIQDAVVPRSRLPEVLGAAYEIAARNKLRIANVFHAGDGNLHPLICFDSRIPEEVQRVKEAGRELMQVCVNAGGTITGEHGVGLDKRELLPLVFSDSDMEAMLSVRAAFDPLGLCNPGKVIPMLRGCGEGKAIATETTPEVEQTLSATILPAKPISSRTGEPIAKQLESLVGPEHFQSDSSRLVVSPSSEAQVQEIIRLAAHDKLLVVPCGSGTWLPDVQQNHLVLNTHRLNRVIEHEPADLVATAQSGVSLVTFNETLAENGQWLPLDPPDDGTATLGGVVATGVGGAQQFGYGKPRGSVIGMKVVLANGALIKAGGRVVKNVAGYDLCKLFTGSFGSLGVITELTFKLRPRPAVQTTIAATGEIAHLYDAARSIVDNCLFPVAVELLSPALAQDVQSIQVDHTSLLLVRFAGNNGAVKFQQDQALSLIRPNCSSVATLENDAALWREVATIPVNQSSGWRASVLPASLPGFVETLSDILGNGFANLKWQMSAGDGRIRVFDELPGDKQQLNQLSVMTNSFAGRLIMAQSPSQSGDGRASQQLAKRVKTKLDPDGIFPQASFR
ncbi:MAG TPA: FAD-binding protein [Pyrinomonadaceae bacterium]